MNDIIQAFLTGIFLFITVYISRYLNILRTNERYSIIYDIVKTAVYAVEQTSNHHGSIKKEEVLKYVQSELSNANIKYDLELLENLIESAVFEMNNMEVIHNG